MKFKWVTAAMLAIFCTPSFAAVRAANGSTDLGVVQAVKCSTGFTCTRSNNQLVLTADTWASGNFTMENDDVLSNAVDDELSFSSDDNHSTLNIIGFEAKSAILKLSADQGDDTADVYSLTADTSDVLTLKNGSTSILSFTSAGIMTLPSGEVLDNATTDDTLSYQSDDNHATFQILGYEAKDAILQLWADQGDDSADKFSLKAAAADTLTIYNNTTALMAFDATGGVTGTGVGAMSGYLQKQVTSTTVGITAAQCGSTFVNDSTDVMTLPEASTVLGCRLTFVVANASNFDINPADGTDLILPFHLYESTAIAPSAGDAIRSATLGASITLEAVGANAWAVISVVDTWADVN